MKVDQAKERLLSFRDLQHGWDSYSAVAIDPGAITAALDLLIRLGDGWTPVPCSDGGVQLEGYVEERHVEILVYGWDV
jgi:hypothetical protein